MLSRTLPPLESQALPSPREPSAAAQARREASRQFFGEVPARPVTRQHILLRRALEDELTAADRQFLRDDPVLRAVWQKLCEDPWIATATPQPKLPLSFLDDMNRLAVHATFVGGGVAALAHLDESDAVLAEACKSQLALPLKHHERRRLLRHPGAEPTLQLLSLYAQRELGHACAAVPRTFFRSYFRPLFAAYAVCGDAGLFRALRYLACCPGAQHAAFVAFPPKPGPTPGAARVLGWNAPERPRANNHALRPPVLRVQSPTPPPDGFEAPANTWAPSPSFCRSSGIGRG